MVSIWHLKWTLLHLLDILYSLSLMRGGIKYPLYLYWIGGFFWHWSLERDGVGPFHEASKGRPLVQNGDPFLYYMLFMSKWRYSSSRWQCNLITGIAFEHQIMSLWRIRVGTLEYRVYGFYWDPRFQPNRPHNKGLMWKDIFWQDRTNRGCQRVTNLSLAYDNGWQLLRTPIGTSK